MKDGQIDLAEAYRQQVEVIVDNTEESIALWILRHAEKLQRTLDDNPTPGWSAEHSRPLHYRQLAELIREGEWRK